MGPNLAESNARLKACSTEEIILWATTAFSGGIAMSSSFGAESALLLSLVTKVVPDIPVIFIDTGYLFSETHAFVAELTKRYGLTVRRYASPVSPEEFELEHGKLWERGVEGKMLYNKLRKVEPMQRALRELGVCALLSGIRADQTKHRATLSLVEMRSDDIARIHPLLGWSKEKVFEYMLANDLPYHPLVYEGFASIGDVHSTVKGSDREGRLLPGEECGLHIDGSGI